MSAPAVAAATATATVPALAVLRYLSLDRRFCFRYVKHLATNLSCSYFFNKEENIKYFYY